MPQDDKAFAVVFCVDRNMFLPALVCASEAARVRGADAYDVVILADSGSIPAEFTRWHQEQGNGIRVIEVDFARETAPGLALSGRLTTAATFRLCLAEFFRGQYKRILYLDADLEVKEPIADLLALDLHGKPFAATNDLTFSPVDQSGLLLARHAFAKREKLGLGPHDRYANTGVLLIDVEEWQKQSLMTRAAAFLRDFPHLCDLADQDALNAVVRGDYPALSARWNYVAPFLDPYGVDPTFHPAIVHYCGNPKPWMRRWRGSRAAADRYARFFRDTPWSKTVLDSELPEPPPKKRSPISHLAHRIEWFARQARYRTIGRPRPPKAHRRLVAAYLRSSKFIDIEQGIAPGNQSGLPLS